MVSWVVLRGRCRTCEAGISWRYPAVELAVGLLWAVVARQGLGDSFEHMVGLVNPFASVAMTSLKLAFVWLLVALAFLDAEHLWLPDWLTFPGVALGMANVILTYLSGTLVFCQPGPLRLAVNWLTGVLGAAGLVLLIRWIYWLLRRREGIGLGDAKLMAMLGAWFGLSGALLSFGIGVILGALFAVVALAIPAARHKSESWSAAKLPLGTFLCMGGIVTALWGQPIIEAYKRWEGF